MIDVAKIEDLVSPDLHACEVLWLILNIRQIAKTHNAQCIHVHLLLEQVWVMFLSIYLGYINWEWVTTGTYSYCNRKIPIGQKEVLVKIMFQVLLMIIQHHNKKNTYHLQL